VPVWCSVPAGDGDLGDVVVGVGVGVVRDGVGVAEGRTVVEVPPPPVVVVVVDVGGATYA
jgi:hypothetical protein